MDLKEVLISYELIFSTKPIQNKYLEEATKRVDEYLKNNKI